MAGISRSGDAAPVWISDGSGNVLGTPANPLQISGGGGGGSGGAVTIADGADTAEGATTAAAYTDTTGAASGTVVGLLKGAYVALRGLLTVQGNAASATTDSGNPVKIGGLANTAAPTSVSNGQRVDAWSNVQGALVVAGFSTTGTDGVLNNAVVSMPGSQAIGSARLFLTAGGVFNGTTWDRQRGDTNGTYSVSKGSGTLATTQVAVTTTAAQIVAARTGRGSVKIQNLGTTDIYLGNTGVTTTTGDLLVGTKGASVTIPTTAAIFAIGAAAGSVSVLEVY